MRSTLLRGVQFETTRASSVCGRILIAEPPSVQAVRRHDFATKWRVPGQNNALRDSGRALIPELLFRVATFLGEESGKDLAAGTGQHAGDDFGAVVETRIVEQLEKCLC